VALRLLQGLLCLQSSIFDLQVIIPSQPIKNFLYWCGREFKLDQIEVLEEKREFNIGAICVNGDEAKFFLVSQPDTTGNIEHKLLKTLSVYLPKGHRKGGQSAPRFQRMYLSALDKYVKDIVNLSLDLFRQDGVSLIKKLLITGNGIRVKHIADEISFVPVEEYSLSTVSELLQVPNVTRLSDQKTLDYLRGLLETDPDLLAFGDEVITNFDACKTVFATDTSKFPAHEKVNKLMTPWLDQFGGNIGILYHPRMY